MKAVLITCVVSVVAVGCAAQPPPRPPIPAMVDRYVQSEMKRQRIPGLALAVIKDGEPVVLRGYGLANVEHRVPVERETVFESGSIAKQFVATAVMMLVDDGKLSLDDRIRKYFPDAPETWDRITIRHLLSHTSGMGDYPDAFDLRHDYSDDELVAMVEKQTLAFAPGEKWSYSNLGYVTLGILINRVTGRSYGEILRDRIFGPLGMKSARVISEADIVPNRAAGYSLVGGELKNQEWVAPSVNTTADGSLYLSIDDMAKWDAALREKRFVPSARLDAMWTPAKLLDGSEAPYGFGWFTTALYGHRVVFHGGAWQGFAGLIIRFLDEPFTIALMANLRPGTNEWRIGRGVAAHFYPSFALPKEAPLEDARPAATRVLRKALLQLAAEGKADEALFTEGARARFFPEGARSVSDGLRSLGLPVAVIHESLELIERSPTSMRYMLTDLGKTLYLDVKITDDDRIAEMRLSAGH